MEKGKNIVFKDLVSNIWLTGFVVDDSGVEGDISKCLISINEYPNKTKNSNLLVLFNKSEVGYLKYLDEENNCLGDLLRVIDKDISNEDFIENRDSFFSLNFKENEYSVLKIIIRSVKDIKKTIALFKISREISKNTSIGLNESCENVIYLYNQNLINLSEYANSTKQ